MILDIQNDTLENFWQFAHFHPCGAILLVIGIFIILIFLCIILLYLVIVLKTISNKVNTITIGKMSFSFSDKALQSTDVESMVQRVISKNDEYRLSFESEAWNILQSKFLKDPYESWQFAAVAVSIINHNFAVELMSSKGIIYTVVICDDKGDYYFSLYSQEGEGALDESRKLSKHFTTAVEIDMFLSKH